MQLKLINKKLEAKNTYSFFFETEKKFEFSPGQYVYLTLPSLKYPDNRGNTRQFTLSNSPTEKNYLQITTRIRSKSGYKKTLNGLKIGDIVEGKGPNGLFVFPYHLVPRTYNLFWAGGIGITPFRSMIKYNIDKNLRVPMHLIYSNSNQEFIFKDEIDKWVDENEFIKVDYINTSKDGRIDKEKLSPLYTIYDIQHTTYWVVGPPTFVSAIEDILEELNVPESNIKTEKFTGY